MAITPTVVSLQSLKVGIKGPDGADSMYMITGLAQINFSASQGQMQKENYALHVGPELGVKQYRRSIASASLAGLRFYDYNPGDADRMFWEVEEVDADFDDESDHVELRFTVEAQAPAGITTITGVAFSVTILAKMDD